MRVIQKPFLLRRLQIYLKRSRQYLVDLLHFLSSWHFLLFVWFILSSQKVKCLLQHVWPISLEVWVVQTYAFVDGADPALDKHWLFKILDHSKKYFRNFISIQYWIKKFRKLHLQKCCRNQSVRVCQFELKRLLDLFVQWWLFFEFFQLWSNKIDRFHILILSKPWSLGILIQIWQHVRPYEKMELPLSQFALFIKNRNNRRA